MMVVHGKCMLTATPAMILLVLNCQKLTKQRVISTVYRSEPTDPSKLICSSLTATHANLTALLLTPPICRLRTMMSTFRTMMTILPGAGSFPDTLPAVEAPGEVAGFLPGPIAMPAAADAVGLDLDVDGAGVDTVTVVVTHTEDGRKPYSS